MTGCCMLCFCRSVSICSVLNCRIQQALEVGYKQLLFAADLFSLTFQLYCSHGRNAPCSFWGKATAISHWAEDRGCYTGRHKAGVCFMLQALLFCAVLVCFCYILLCFIVLGRHGAARSVLSSCCCAPRRTALIEWRIRPSLDWEEVEAGQTEANGGSHCSLMSASRIQKMKGAPSRTCSVSTPLSLLLPCLPLLAPSPCLSLPLSVWHKDSHMVQGF